jgi:hypothetical protein
MTLARDAGEKRALEDALGDLAACGLPVFVTDGGSDEGFVDAIRRFPDFTVCPPCTDGLWPQIERSLARAYASGARFVLYTEPDKRVFFRERLQRFVVDAPDAGEVGIVLATRDEAAMATFPPFQQYTESVINRCCTEVLGKRFDYSYGPFLIHREVLPRLSITRREIAWGWRPYAFGIAHRLGLRVEQLEYGCACPAEQRGDSERVYRMQQLAQSVEGLVMSTKAALG